MNANKYFIIYKLCLETRNSKIVEITLYYIQVFLTNWEMCSFV